MENEGHLDPPPFNGNFPLKDFFYSLCLPLIKNINILVNPLISDVRPEDHPSLEMEVDRTGRSAQYIC